MRWLIWITCICLFISGCSTNEEEVNYETIGEEIITAFVNQSDAGDLNSYLDTSKQDALIVADLIELWEATTEFAGEYNEIESMLSSSKGNGYVVVTAILVYTELKFQVRLTFNEKAKLVGFSVVDSQKRMVLADSLMEEVVIVGENTPYELDGLLTLPKELSEEKIPAVVLVHGSGPSDKDEAVFAYQPFKDIAWELAEHNIAVLRYDKRTFTYGDTMSAEEIRHMTVKEETVEDAIKASELLKLDPRIDEQNIFILGHSLGGMLAPRIAAEGEDLAGIISLAGSPRPLWEIIYDQNQTVLAEIADESVRKEQEAIIEAEYEKAKQIEQLSIEEAKSQKVFDIPAYYFWEMDQYQPIKLITDLDIPTLILQGEDDFQVSFQRDFAMWKDKLKDNENVTWKSYQGLNHFFIHYEGQDKGTIAEYKKPANVASEVMNDIGEWIVRQSKRKDN